MMRLSVISVVAQRFGVRTVFSSRLNSKTINKKGLLCVLIEIAQSVEEAVPTRFIAIVLGVEDLARK